MRPRAKAWLALALGVIWWDVTCDRDETLSAACRDARKRAPVATVSAVLYAVLHLLGLIPEDVDVLRRLPDGWKQ